MRIYNFVLINILGCLFLAAPVQAGEIIADHAAIHYLDHSYEKMLIDALQKVKKNDIGDALTILQQVVNNNPKFRLAQLMYADLLLAQARPISGFGSYPSASYERIKALRDEAAARWRHYLSPPPADRVPASLVQLSGLQKYVIVVDMSASRLYLFENKGGVPRPVYDFYTSIGKKGMRKYAEGDQKTPVGVYFVTGFISPDTLPDLYGNGAFPIDYPNAWDQRHGRTGSGIWLHGTPGNTYSRPPKDSDGCVVLTNRDLDAIAPYIQKGTTPVILTEKINWLTVDKWRKRQAVFAGYIDQWRKDWESRNTDLYLRHYSPNYSGLGKDYRSWVEYKRRVNASKKFIHVDISNQSMFLYPGEKGLLVVTFKQDYRSDTVQREFVKRQYWKMGEDGRWRIVYEGSAS